MREVRTLVVGCVLAAALLLVSCSAGSESVDSAAGIPKAPPVDAADIRLPIESYIISGAEANAYNAAQRVLTNQCMERYGFSPDPEVSAFSEAASIVSSFTARRYLLVDREQAAVYGYHVGLTQAFVEEDQSRADAAARARDSAPSDPAALVARSRMLVGDPSSNDPEIRDGGCVGVANRALRGESSGLAWSQTAIELQQESYDAALADPRTQEAFAAWSQCMSEQGFDYPTPVDANNDPAWAVPVPDEREISTAVADVDCKEGADVLADWSGVETELQEQMIEEHAEELEEMRARDEAALEEAAQVMQRSGS